MAARNSSTSNLSLRAALGNFVTGVTIVTTIDDMGRPRGLTANSFTSVSLAPPMVLVCIGSHASSFSSFRHCQGFSVNVLHEDQRPIAELFATKAPNKFDHVTWETGATGAPRIRGSLSTFDCQTDSWILRGDHLILLGKIDDFAAIGGRPLVFGQGSYISSLVEQEAIARSRGNEVLMSCIVGSGDKILLLRQETATERNWEIPHVALEAKQKRGLLPLKELFRQQDIDAELTFLYAVFELEEPPHVHIVYRGICNSTPRSQSNAHLFDEKHMPWSCLHPCGYEGMLRRYFQERALDSFGIYTGLSGEGRVARLESTPVEWGAYLSTLDNSRNPQSER